MRIEHQKLVVERQARATGQYPNSLTHPALFAEQTLVFEGLAQIGTAHRPDVSMTVKEASLLLRQRRTQRSARIHAHGVGLTRNVIAIGTLEANARFQGP